MDLQSIADELVAGCREGRELANLDKLYAPDAVSAEAFSMGDAPRVIEGLDGIKGKHAWWEANFEYHGGEILGPYLHGEDRFAVIFRVDATNKADGVRTKMEEVAIYTVADGKIVSEEFYYTM